jgi:inner membrane protein
LDSVTQIALGAAVSEAVMGNKVGRRASLWGAVLGTLPDLDVLIPMGDAVRDFTYHRAESHSFFFMALVSPIILWIILKFHPNTKVYKKEWLLLIILTLFTHSILDGFTVYGTQMFLPFSNYPVGWSTIFIIDPLYTLLLSIGVISLFLSKNSNKRALKINLIGIILSTTYLIWSIGVKSHVDSKAEISLNKQNIGITKLLSTPSPFNTLLWRIIGVTDSGYVEGFYSIFDNSSRINFTEYKSDEALLYPLSDLWEVDRLKWFTKGFYKVGLEDDKITITDLRMGLEPYYFFSFAIEKQEAGRTSPLEIKKLEPKNFDIGSGLNMLWDRIWDENNKVLFTNRHSEETTSIR